MRQEDDAGPGAGPQGSPDPAVLPLEGHGPWSATVLVFGRGTGALGLDLREPVRGQARRALERLGLTGPFAVITPCNPRGQVLPPEENAARLAVFHQEVTGLDPHAVHAEGRAVDGVHCEPGWAINLPLAVCAALARRWDQLGFYWWDGRAFGVVLTGLIGSGDAGPPGCLR